MIHAAIFDMDGLLFDTERLCCDAWRSVASAAGYAMEDDLFLRCVGRNNRDTKSLVMDALGPDFPYDDFNRDARVWMQARMAENGPPEKPGIRVLFDFLKSSNIPIALATSTSEKSARWMIERAGLTPYFTAFAFGSEVERGKPEPDIFLLARDRIGAATEVRRSDECVVFEDSPAGLRAAAAAGMKPVFIKDLVTPTSDVLALVWKEIPSLEQAASEEFFRSI
jgi:beta-phosphoglucomutase-like phosphatase (HAD superfamily)